MKAKVDAPFVPLNIAVLTVSDTRTLETDTSGQVFVDRLSEAGHQLAARVVQHQGALIPVAAMPSLHMPSFSSVAEA